MIPILSKHNQADVLGRIDVAGDRLLFSFIAPVTEEKMFEIFGNCGVNITEAELVDGVLMINEGEILEFSLP